MKFLSHNGVMYLWGQIKKKLDKKVDKVSGKGLSANDYTTAEKDKLKGIAAGANNYTHPSTHPASIITGLPTKLPADGGNAETAEKWKTARNINGMLIDGTEHGINYVSRVTTTSNDDRIFMSAVCSGFSLIDGAEITVKLDGVPVGNDDKNLELNINNTGSHLIWYGDNWAKKKDFTANRTYTFRYYKGCWYVVGELLRPSSTVPKKNGEASAGSENKFARGDHVHPLQESVAKLSTARNISVSGDMVGSGVAFDGTTDINISVCRRGCAVGQLTSTATRPWYKFAAIMLNRSDDVAITFRVSNKYASYASN